MKISRMYRFLCIVGALFGLYKLMWWFQTPSASMVDFLLALLFVGWGLNYFFEDPQHRSAALVMRFVVGLLVLGAAAYWERTLFMWGLGGFVLVTAVLDTFWPSG